MGGNRLKTLRSIDFTQADQVFLQHNLLPSFKSLPKMQKVRNLYLQDNCIENFDGIKTLPHTLESLDLSRNPISFTLGYRKAVYKELPNLIYLDGIAKLSED